MLQKRSASIEKMDLKERVHLLEEVLHQEQMRTAALTVMIDFAKREYGIPIKQKAGIKQ